jgi:hypothetical protein
VKSYLLLTSVSCPHTEDIALFYDMQREVQRIFVFCRRMKYSSNYVAVKLLGLVHQKNKQIINQKGKSVEQLTVPLRFHFALQTFRTTDNSSILFKDRD